MKKHAISKVLLAILTSAGISSLANAATLGTLTTYSFLNEPLHALIEVSGVSADKNIDTIKATIGTVEMYRNSGLRRPDWLDQASITVTRMDNGKIALKITAPTPIEDPASALIVQLTIENVAAKKEYALILDPKDSKEAQQLISSLAQTSPASPSSAPPQDANTQIQSPIVSQNGTQIIKKPSTKISIKKNQQSVEDSSLNKNIKPLKAPSNNDNNEQITVSSGDTLGKIVSKMPTNASAHQWMVAFVKQNPHAFDANNINRLKSGAILKVPTSEQANEISREIASQEVSQQMHDWNSWRQNALKSASSKTLVPDSQGQGSIQKAPAPKVSQEDALKIEQSPKSKANEIAQNKQAQEANDRAKELEKIAQDMRSLLELKNQQIAKMQKELEELQNSKKTPVPEQNKTTAPPKDKPLPQNEAPANGTEKPTPTPSTSPTPDASTNESKDAKADDKSTESVQNTTPPASEATAATPSTTTVPPVASDAASQPVAKPKAPAASKPKVRQPLVIPPVEEPKPEELDVLGLIASPFGAGAGAILALLFGLFGFKQYQKRKQRLSGATRSPETIGPGNAAAIDATQLPEDLELSQVEEHIKGSDTFYAFGKFEKALHEVQLSLDIEPDNANALIRALRCCAKTNQSELFAKYHQDLLESAEQTDQMLAEAKALEAELFENKTENSFLSEIDSGSGMSSLEEFLAPHDDSATQVTQEEPQSLKTPITELNFELDSKILEEPEPAPQTQVAEVSTQEQILDFKPSTLDAPRNEHSVSVKTDENLMEFNLPSLSTDDTESTSNSTPVTESFDLSLPDDLSSTPSGLEDFVVAQNVEIQPLNIEPLIAPTLDVDSQLNESISLAENKTENAEMRTMFDLAKAYHEMGDVEGAKELLNEIIQEDADGIVGQEAKKFQQSI